METKAKLPKKLLSMFLAVLMAFSCFSLVMPELVPEAKAASANYGTLQAAFDAAKSAGVLASGSAPTGTTISDAGNDSYLYNIAEALAAVINDESKSYSHNLRLRAIIKSNLSLNSVQQAFIDTMLPSSGNYNTYPLQNGSGGSNAHTVTTDWACNSAPADPAAPSAGSAFSVTVKRSAAAAIIDDYSSVTEIPANVATSITITYTPAISSSCSTGNKSHTTGSGCDEETHTDYNKTRTTYWKNGSVKSSVGSSAHGVNFNALSTYITYVTTNGQFNTDYNAWLANEAVIYGWSYEKLSGVVTAYENGGATAVNEWALTSPNSLFITKFIPKKTAEKGYDAFIAAVSSTMEAASYKKYVDWIMSDITFENYPESSAYDAESDKAADRAQMVTLRQHANDFKAIIDAKPGMAKTLADVYGYDVNAYANYAERLTDYIEQYDLRQVKYIAQYRAENASTDAPYGNPNGNAPGMGLFGITDHVSYSFTQAGETCPVSDEMLSGAYQDYLTYLSIIDGMQDENVSAVFKDGFTEQDVIDTKNALLVEINFRDRLIDYGGFATYFEAIITTDWSTKTAVFIEDKIADAKTQLAAFEALYTRTVNEVGTEKAQQIFGSFIEERAKKAAIDETLYQTLYIRSLNQLQYVKEVRADGVNAQNFSLVKRALKLVDHDLYNYIVTTTGVGAYYTQDEINALKAIYDLLDDYQTEVDEQQKRIWEHKRVNLEVKTESGAYTDYYTIREAVNQDMVRDPAKAAHDYKVTSSNVESVIDKLDNFLTSDDFTQLIGAYDEEKGITNLSEYIEDMIVTSLFTDEMVNTLVSALFPMLANLLVNELKGMLGDMGGVPAAGADGALALNGLIAPGTVIAEDVTLVGDIKMNSLSGNLSLWLDGKNGSMKIIDLAKQLGLNVFPDVLASTLAGSANKANYADIISKLSAAGTDWNKLDADGDGTITVEDLADFEWGVTDYESFVAVIGDIFNSVLPLLRAVFTNTTFSRNITPGSADCIIYAQSLDARFNLTAGWIGTADASADAGAGGIKGKITSATIGINGIRGYENVWAALFETFGVTATTSSFNVTEEYPLSTTIGNDTSGSASAQQFVNALFMPIMSLINTLSNRPLDTILNILPNLTHSLTYNLVQELLNALTLELTLNDINLDIEQAKLSGNNTIGKIVGVLDGILPGILESAVNPLSLDPIELALGSMLNLSDLIGCDITDLNAIIEMIFATAIEELAVEGIDAIDIPTFNTGLVAQLGTLGTASSIRTQNFNGYPGIGAYQRPTIKADRADVFYYLIQWVISFIAEEGNLERLLQLLDMGTIDASLSTLLGNIDAENALAALCELFVPQDPQYEMAEYNWYQPNSPQSVYNFAGADFVYLKYANNWTLEKAEYVYNNLDGIINTIIGMIDPDMLAGYENGVSDMFLEKVNEIFNNEGIGGVLKMMTDLGNSLAGQDAILGILERDLGIDLTVWYNSFGYLFSEYYGEKEETVEPEEGETVDPDAEPEKIMVPFGPPTPADGQYGKPGVDYGTYENLFPLLEVEVTETKEPQLDENNQPQYDEDGNQLFTTTYEYKFIYDGKELVDGSEDARLVFTDIFTYLAQPLAPVVELLLTGKDLTLFNGAITFNGADAYNGALIPLFETIGIYDVPTAEEYKAMCAADGATAAFNVLIDILFDFVDDFLATEILEDGTVYGPFQKLVELVPNVFYFLQSGGLSTFVKNLLHSVWVLVDTVRPIVDLDIDDFLHQFLCQYLELTYDKSEYGSSDIVNLLMDLIDPDYVAPEYSEEAAAEDKETVDTIYSITIEDLSLPAIFDLLNAMFGIDLAPVTYAIEGMSFGYSRTVDGTSMQYGVQSFESMTGKTACRSIGYGPDIITVLISSILDVLRYGDNAAAIDGLLGFINENTEEDIGGDISAAGILEALVTIFEDKVGIEYEQPNWDYLLEGKYVAETDGNEHEWVDGDYDTLAIASDFSKYHTLKNLEYLTDWTETTAQVTEAEFSGLLDFVASMLDENYDDLGAYLNDLLENELFTAENLKGLVDAIAQLYDFLPADILDLVDELLDIDLKSWLAYVEIAEVEKDGETVTAHVAKADHEWWADPAAEAYIDSKEEFLGAFETLLHGIDTVVGLIFLGEDYKLFHTMGGGQEAPDYGDDAIVLDGFNAYGYSLAPIFEALGYTVENGGLKEVSAYVVENADGTTTYKNAELISDVMNLLVKIVDDIAADPAKWIIDVLPGLTYFINANGLTTSINNILNSVNNVIDAINSILGEDQQIDLSALLGEIDLSDLTMDALLGFVEEGLGLYINPALTTVVEDFYMGDVVVYDSANGNRAFTMTYTTVEQRHDMVTVLLAFLLEVVTDAGNIYDETGAVIGAYDNAAALDALIAGEDGENKGIVSAIVAAVKDPDSVIYGNIDWGYMYGDSKLEDRTARLADDGFPAVSFTYTKYATDWTEDTAKAVYAELNSVVAYLLGEFAEGNTIASLLESVLNDNVYTDKNLKTIVELIVNALAGVNESLRNIIGAVVTADINAWFAMCDETTDDEGKTVYVLKENYFSVDTAADKKQAFIDGIMEIIIPANRLLSWLFFEDTYTFFTSTDNKPIITLQGGKGYAEGLVPILEALGLEMQPAENFWIQPLDGSEGYYNAAGAVEGILESVLGLVDKISENPAKEALALIPNLLYFINADGLKTSVTNLVAPIDTVLRSLKDLVGGESIADLLAETIGFDLNNLSTETVLALLSDKAGFVMNEEMTDVIERIYGLGTAAAFESANGKTAYKVDITGREYDVLTVILSFAIDAFKLNRALFADLLPEGVYDAIVELIAGININADPINWAYMYSGNMAELERSGFPATKLTYLKYATDWTETTADSVYSVLDEILELVLPAVIEDGDLKALVTDLIEGNLYKTENLEAIVELIVNAIAGFDVSLRNAVDAVLDVNIADWFKMCEPNAEGKYEVIPGTFNVTDKDSFVAGLKTVLAPANELLSWLFFGTSYTFFNGTTSEVLITVNGGKGYAYGIVPILEALGLEMKKAEAYKGADGKYNVGKAVEDIIDAVLTIVDKLGAADSTVEYAFTLIPNLLYFINSDGLKTSVNNLVAPVDAIIGCLSDVVGAESLAALLTDVIGIDISNLETRTLLTLLESELGFVMNAEMRGAIYQIYAVGKADKFASANGKTAYRLVPDMGDALTVILSFALDAFNLNEAIFAELLGEEEYKAVYNLIRGAKDQFVYTEIDWGYMYEGEALADRLALLEAAGGKMPNYPESSTAATYLLYGNNWNKETAEYVNEVIDAVIAGAMEGTELGEMLDNAIANGLYQDSILNSLLEAVVGLIVDYAEIIEGAGALLGAESISKWFDYCTVDGEGNVTVTHDFGIDEAKTNEAKREKFVEAFVDVLEPAYRLLAWLLFDQDFTFFNGTTEEELITLTGGRGYEEALVPLLEALGAKMPGVDAAYTDGKSGIKPASAYVTEDGVDMEAAVRDVFSALVCWLEQICGNLANQGEYGVIGAMLDLLPNVIYNINAGTLKAVVQNLLVPVEEILGHLEAFGLEVDFTSLVKINDKTLDITNLDWYSVFMLVEELVRLYWPANIQEFLATLYVGEAVEFESANGKTAYYMTYNADDEGNFLVSGREDMITLLISFVIDGVLDKRNAPRLSGWLGEDIYNVIYAYLADEIVKVPMQDVDWQLTEYADTGKVVSPITLGAKINSEFYGELYTREMGEYIEKWLPSFVDSMIVLLGIKSESGDNYEGLEDILNELIGTSLYTKENIQAILDAVKGLLPEAQKALGAELYDVIVNVLEKALGIDLNYWNDYTVADFETGDREAFVNELTRMFVPLYPILRWLLTDEDLIALFYTAEGRDAVVIEGAEGYAYGIIPLLEAFDYDSERILTPDEFSELEDAPSMLKAVLNPVLDVVDKVLADPVNEIFNVLPGVIYFLNSNGLDTVIKNTANAVFTVLENIEPITGELDIYELIGFDAENINVETLISEFIKGLEEDTGFQLTEVALEALKELTVGTVKSYASKNGKTAYTVEYATGADRVDMVTVVLRTVLTFVSIPENVTALEGMLEGELDEEGYKFVCSLLENFSQMAASEGGMDEIMYTVYQIFYAANVAAHSTENWLAEFNGDYSFLNQLFATSDLDFLRQIEISLGDLLNKYTGDIIDDDEVVPNGFIAFFQKIADFFKMIGDFFRNLFK